jgi:hypothetical protein
LENQSIIASRFETELISYIVTSLFFVLLQTATNFLNFTLNRFKSRRIPESTVCGKPPGLPRADCTVAY